MTKTFQLYKVMAALDDSCEMICAGIEGQTGKKVNRETFMEDLMNLVKAHGKGSRVKSTALEEAGEKSVSYNGAGDFFVAAYLNYKKGNVEEAISYFKDAMKSDSIEVLISAINDMNTDAAKELEESESSETEEVEEAESNEEEASEKDDEVLAGKGKKKKDEEDDDEDEDEDDDEDDEEDDDEDEDEDDEDDSCMSSDEESKTLSRDARALANKISMYGSEESLRAAKKLAIQS